MWTIETVLVGLNTLAVAGLGATWLFGKKYAEAYLGKKAENLATHEDIQKLVDQVKAVTSATKEIEEKLSNESWDRQRQWELKRDVVFEAARKVGRETDAMSRLYSVYNTDKINASKGLPGRSEKRIEVGAVWNDAAAEYEGLMILVNASCNQELLMAYLTFGQFMRQLSLQIMDEKPESFMERAKEMAEKSHNIAIAIRNELGIAKRAMPLSSGSSATPTPARPTP